jgi:lipid-binding SYLF domain-containing protein
MIAASATALLMATPAFAQLKSDDIEKLSDAAMVLTELRNTPEGIPESTWNKAHCVLVIPSLKKAGFIVGGEHGSGVMSCRHGKTWGPPIFMEMTKASAGLQAGISSTDLVLLVMNENGADKLLRNKVTLGADASVAAGPVGRTATAGTDVQLTAEMLSYSRSKGLFAGVNLSGGSLAPDESKNARAYGPTASARDVALGITPVKMTPEERAFTNALAREARGTSGVK